MTGTRKIRLIILVAVALTCASFAVSASHAGKQKAGLSYTSDASREENSGSLASFMVNEDENPQSGQESAVSEGDLLDERGRLSQRVTICDDNGTLPITGTVTKNQDAFYPGTYELKFSTNAILGRSATVQVKMDVYEGETVYILTGDKEKGYTQIGMVTADSNKVVCFDTTILQDYTLSTTDIAGAQAALASYTGR